MIGWICFVPGKHVHDIVDFVYVLDFLVWGGLGAETMARALGKESCLNMMLVK